MYVFNLLETYVAGLSLLSTVFFEAIAVSWLYGREIISTYQVFGLNAFSMKSELKFVDCFKVWRGLRRI